MADWLFGKKARGNREQRRKDYEALGKQVSALYDSINPDRAGLYRTAFLKGIVTGLGGVIGATLVIFLIAATLSLFHRVPLLGPISDNIRHTLQEH